MCVMILKSRELKSLAKGSVRNISRYKRNYFVHIDHKEKIFHKLGEAPKGLLFQGNTTGRVYAVYGKGMKYVPFLKIK